MRFIVNVDPKRFDDFAIGCALNHYSKTSPFIILQKPDFYRGDLLGVEDDGGKLIAGAVMIFRKTMIPAGQYAYCQYGFNLDIADSDLIRFFALSLKEYARSCHAFFLRMDFNITRLEHEKDGRVKEDGFNHEYVTEILKECGFEHLGYNYGYSGNWMSRYTYRLDLDRPFAEILKGIKRCSIQTAKNETRCIKVHKADRNELGILVQNEELLSSERGFKAKDLAWFEKLWDCYEPYIHYYVATGNFHAAKENLIAEKKEEEEHLAEMKNENKMEPVRKKIDAISREIDEITDGGYDRDEEIALGAKLIIMQGVNVWNVNMYTKKTLMNFRPAFALHRYAIEDLYQQGAKTYDFEGISGSLDPHDEYYGQQDFKKSFGGDFLEFIGEFDAVFNKDMYNAWKNSDQLYRRIRRKVRYILNKEK